MGCNCGKKKIVITSAQAEEMRQAAQSDYERRVAAESAKASTGEHGPTVVR